MPFHTLNLSLMDNQTAAGSLLPFKRIRAVAKAALACGIARIQLTGGDPLDREDIPVLCMMLSSLPGFSRMTLETDGLLLPRWAKALRGAGVRDVTVKLDTFSPATYRQMTNGGDLTAALAGIRAAMEVGFPPITLQVRLLGGVNDVELASLAQLTKHAGVSLRLVEQTDEEAAALGAQALACEDALARIPGLAPDGDGYRLPGASGTVALLPVSARGAGVLALTADGMLRAGETAVSVRDMDDAQIEQTIQNLMS